MNVQAVALPAQEPAESVRCAVEHWRQSFSRDGLDFNLETRGQGPFFANSTVLTLGDLRASWSESSPLAMLRDERHIVPRQDGVTLNFSVNSQIKAMQDGLELSASPGQAIALFIERPSDLIVVEGGQWWGLQAGSGDLNRRLSRPLETSRAMAFEDANTLELLRLYILQLARMGHGHQDPVLIRMVEQHILDLVALMLEASRHSPADSHSVDAVHAARLVRLQAIIKSECHNPALTLDDVAARAGMSSRNVQITLSRHGTTFSDLLRQTRLQKAMALLRHPRKRRVIDVALDVGFSDLSAFTRAFRRQFGITPAEARLR